MIGGEFNKITKRIYTTSRGNDSNEANTFQMDYATFRGTRKEREAEWIEIVLRQIGYIEAGLKREGGMGTDMETTNWLERNGR